MSKNIKFPPSQFGIVLEGVRERKWRALHREKYIVDLGVYIISAPPYCFFRVLNIVDLTDIYLITKQVNVCKVDTIFIDRIALIQDSIESYGPALKKVYAVFDSEVEYLKWKITK